MEADRTDETEPRDHASEELRLARMVSWARWSALLSLLAVMLLAPNAVLLLADRFQMYSVPAFYNRIPFYREILVLGVPVCVAIVGLGAVAFGIAGVARANTHNRTLAKLGIGLGGFLVCILAGAFLWVGYRTKQDAVIVAILGICYLAGCFLLIVYRICCRASAPVRLSGTKVSKARK